MQLQLLEIISYYILADMNSFSLDKPGDKEQNVFSDCHGPAMDHVLLWDQSLFIHGSLLLPLAGQDFSISGIYNLLSSHR